MNRPEYNAILALIFTTLIILTTSTQFPEPYVQFCDTDKGTFPDSTNGNNLKILLESLPTNTSLAGGFYNTSIGNGSDQVYGKALCRGDVKEKDCSNCLRNAAQDILKNCTAQEAIYWYPYCQIHYSSLQITNGYTGKFPSSNSYLENVSDTVHFPSTLMDFMQNLSYSGSSSALMFATREVKLSESEKIYGLVQCTRDVSQEECNSCFHSALLELEKCCSLRKGGTVFSKSCNVRFEMHRFYQDSTTRENAWKKWGVGTITAFAFVLVLLITCCVFHLQRNKTRRKDEEESHNEFLQNLENHNRAITLEDSRIVGSEELIFMEFSIVKEATDNFSDANKLGQGGFGTVYKGILPDGKEIAVKRLSRKSWQGIKEFKNEVILLARLQHRNLVRLIACGVEGNEKLLLYEFMPNNSLDVIIFDSEERVRLDWDRCLSIISGISRGLLYLHEDSRLKIIHRDLKPSNILLDHEMAAKISDFGMARIFGEDQNTANTRRVVGTYGYMAPEYAMEGHFSVKSDVFSFGVILLEIISGKKNSGFYLSGKAQSLLAYAWQLWYDGQELDFLDPLLRKSCSMLEARRLIHIGLLCVQEYPEDRPIMSSVMVLLSSETILELPQPKKPAFSVGRLVTQIDYYSSTNPSVNHLTVSNISLR